MIKSAVAGSIILSVFSAGLSSVISFVRHCLMTSHYSDHWLVVFIVKGNEMANLGNYQAAVNLFTEAINLDAKDFRFVCFSFPW